MFQEQKKEGICLPPCTKCRVCGADGTLAYMHLADRLFEAPGTWCLYRCTNRACRMVWLDPVPLPEDLRRAYADYYTHELDGVAKRSSLARRVYSRIKSDYIARAYAYPPAQGNRRRMNFGWLMNMFPFRRDEVDLELCYLRAQPGGSLLDVGCGSGDWLVQMKARGWQVRGVDFDSRAVHVARERGLIVESGALDEQLYPDGSFDAVVLNHVIEHVPDPRSTLVECERVLKKGGRLALITPNANSLAHRLLHKDWRGLEPPRHLHIFTPGSMTSLLKQAGFYEARIWTVNSRYIWNLSWQLRTRDRVGVPYTPIVELRTRLAAYAFTLIEQVAILAMPRTGECLAVAAIKAAN